MKIDLTNIVFNHPGLGRIMLTGKVLSDHAPYFAEVIQCNPMITPLRRFTCIPITDLDRCVVIETRGEQYD